MESKIEVVKKASDVIDKTSGAWDFFSDWHDRGFWHAATGQDFLPWLHDFGINLLSLSDVLVFAGVVLVFLIIAGSGRAKKWLWWDIIIYFVAKAVQVYIQ